MDVVASVFNGADMDGDFRWMIEQPEYADALFVFNDNEERFRAYRSNPGDRYGCAPGGGNAVIRPYRCAHPARSAGIPTGSHRVGYPELTEAVRDVIDDAFTLIQGLIATGGYRRIIYSADDTSGSLGTGIFDVGVDVKDYIVRRLRQLSEFQ